MCTMRTAPESPQSTATAAGTKRGEGGENLQSDFAANDVRKVWYRTSHLGSTLFAVDENGKVISHTIYDPWGNPLTKTYTDTNSAALTTPTISPATLGTKCLTCISRRIVSTTLPTTGSRRKTQLKLAIIGIRIAGIV